MCHCTEGKKCGLTNTNRFSTGDSSDAAADNHKLEALEGTVAAVAAAFPLRLRHRPDKSCRRTLKQVRCLT